MAEQTLLKTGRDKKSKMKWQGRVKNRENNRYKYKENPILKSFP